MYKPKYFTEDEFKKVHCSMSDINPSSLARLDAARALAGIPFFITSAFRTQEQNKFAGGVSRSAHLRGRAFDIACNPSNRYQIVKAAIDAGFTRIGVSHRFIHMDDDSSLPGPRLWTY